MIDPTHALHLQTAAHLAPLPTTERVEPDWTALPAPRPGLAVSVVVPVRDEAARLGATLRSLAAQQDAHGAPLDPARFEVIVLANNCQDATADLARRFAARHRALALHAVEVHFPAALAHVGHARASLMAEASRRLRRTAGDGGVIASTDGDTRVGRRWVAALLAEFAGGADAVGGRIISRADAGDSPALRALVSQDDRYRRWRTRLECLLDGDPADPWPRHHQHFGASLAVRVAAFEAVGGCPPVPWLEDEALARALRGRDLAIRHSLQVRVVTSGRRQGRVQIGLSQQLRAWASMAEQGEEPQVCDPAFEAATWQLRAGLRRHWRASPRQRAPQPLDGLAVHLGLATDRIAAAWRAAAFFGAFWNEVEAMAAQGGRAPVRVGQRDALRQLRGLVRAASTADRNLGGVEGAGAVPPRPAARHGVPAGARSSGAAVAATAGATPQGLGSRASETAPPKTGSTGSAPCGPHLHAPAERGGGPVVGSAGAASVRCSRSSR